MPLQLFQFFCKISARVLFIIAVLMKDFIDYFTPNHSKYHNCKPHDNSQYRSINHDTENHGAHEHDKYTYEIAHNNLLYNRIPFVKQR